MKKIIAEMKEKNFSERMIEFILTRSNEELGELTIKKITCLLNISRSHLYQQFKKGKKITPGQFLLLMKIIRSASLLANSPDLSVEKIAKKMGFSCSDYFKKVFREYFGTTPGRYRKYVRGKFDKKQISH